MREITGIHVFAFEWNWWFVFAFAMNNAMTWSIFKNFDVPISINSQDSYGFEYLKDAIDFKRYAYFYSFWSVCVLSLLRLIFGRVGIVLASRDAKIGPIFSILRRGFRIRGTGEVSFTDEMTRVESWWMSVPRQHEMRAIEGWFLSISCGIVFVSRFSSLLDLVWEFQSSARGHWSLIYEYYTRTILQASIVVIDWP